MSSLFRPCIERMSGYVPGAQPRERPYIKLNANENPYPPSPKVLAALRAAVGETLRLYPDSMATELREKIAERHGLSPREVLVGNGSDDLLTMIIRCFVGERQVVAAPHPTYPLYDVLVAMQNGRMRWVDFPEDFSLPAGLAEGGAGVPPARRKGQARCLPHGPEGGAGVPPARGKGQARCLPHGPAARVTFLANPNSPSGTWIEPEAIAELAGRLKGVLVVDEAYVDFAEGDCLGLLGRFPNVIVLRSFSKSFSLAGVRLGYALASETILSGLVKVKDSYNVNRFALAAGVAALDDIEYMRANVAKIRAERARVSESLRKLGFSVYPSQANFVAARRATPAAQAMRDALQERGILIRSFGDPKLRDWIRISIGTVEQNGLVLAGIAEVLGRK